MHRFKENIKYDQGIQPQVPGTGTRITGNYVWMAKYNNFAMGCMLAAHTQITAGATFYIAESTDSTHWSTLRMATATLSSSTTTCTCTTIEVRAEEMTNLYQYLRGEVVMSATCNTAAIAAGYMRFNARYPQASLKT